MTYTMTREAAMALLATYDRPFTDPPPSRDDLADALRASLAREAELSRRLSCGAHYSQGRIDALEEAAMKCDARGYYGVARDIRALKSEHTR